MIVIASFLAMEAVAWSAHKYIMHGWGWGWHRDHHEPHDGFLERNDLYALVGAAISIGAFSLGSPLVMGERHGGRAHGSASACCSMAWSIR
jgi:beta-carotene 3-hydroxylase